jgi:hypothetical protein
MRLKHSNIAVQESGSTAPRKALQVKTISPPCCVIVYHEYLSVDQVVIQPYLEVLVHMKDVV